MGVWACKLLGVVISGIESNKLETDV